MYTMFRDNRAPPDTPYSVWQTEEDDSALLVSFYTTMFPNYVGLFVGVSVGVAKIFFQMNRNLQD